MINSKWECPREVLTVETAVERPVGRGNWEWDIPVIIAIVQSYVSDEKEKQKRNINKLSLNKERNL